MRYLITGRLLHQASVWENAELLEDLLKNGEEVANINAEDKYGRTALHLAAGSGNSSLVAVLLSAGGTWSLIVCHREH